MRRKWWIVILAVALFGAARWAFADATLLPQLDVRVTATPETVTEPCEVELQFTFENSGETALTEISLTSPDGISTEEVGSLSAHSALTHTLKHDVTDTEMSAGTVSYLITCGSEGKIYSFPIEVHINRSDSGEPVEFLRCVDSRFAPANGQITVVYQVINRSSAAISNITVTDTIDAYSKNVESIASGETVNLVHNVNVNNVMFSAPTLTYERNGAQSTIQLGDLALRVAHASLKLDFSAELKEDGSVQAVLHLDNTGDVDIRSITVYDDLYGGIVDDGKSLALSDAPMTIAHEYAARSGESYRWRVVYTDASGTSFSQTTETVSVDSPSDDSKIALTLTAEPKWEKIRQAGYVPITFTIHSTGFAQNIRITESTLGEIRTLACADATEDTVWSQAFHVAESREYQFAITYTDSLGREQTVEAEPISVKIGSGGATPQTTNGHTVSPFTQTVSTARQSGEYIAVLIASALLLIVLIIAALILTGKIRKARKNSEHMHKKHLHEGTWQKALINARHLANRESTLIPERHSENKENTLIPAKHSENKE